MDIEFLAEFGILSWHSESCLVVIWLDNQRDFTLASFLYRAAVGRPRINVIIREFVVRVAKETGWGYSRPRTPQWDQKYLPSQFGQKCDVNSARNTFRLLPQKKFCQLATLQIGGSQEKPHPLL